MRSRASIVVLAAALLAGGCDCATGDGGSGEGTGGRFRAERVALLADGRMLVGGVAERRAGGEGTSGCDGTAAIVQLDARGRPGARFGAGGSAEIRPDEGECTDSVTRLLVDAGGRTLVGSTVFRPSDPGLEDTATQRGDLRRLTASGRVDAGWQDGRSGFRFAVAPDGSSFDEQGSRRLPGGARDPRDETAPVRVRVDLAADVAAQPGGGKLFLGLQDRANHRRLAVERFGADWRPDAGFGAGGVATADVAPGERLERVVQPELERVLPAPGGGVIAFGLAFGPRRPFAFAIRLDGTGRLDRAFGARGRLELGPPDRSREVYDVAVQADGSLVAIGSAGASERRRRWFVARYDARGRPDRRFGREGRVTLPAGPLGVPRGVAARLLNRGNRDGALAAGADGAVAGVASLTGPDGSTLRSVAFRLRANGSPDARFGRHGVQRLVRLP